MTAEIEMLAPATARDTELVAAATGLVNKVYGESEQGLWADSAARTTSEEVTAFIQAGELAAAYLDGELVGIVRIQQLDAETGEFGMLAADPACGAAASAGT